MLLKLLILSVILKCYVALALTACRPKAFSGHRKRAQEIDTNDVDQEYEETVTR